jgi:prepilin-type processing-associated H-X9-DG protein
LALKTEFHSHRFAILRIINSEKCHCDEIHFEVTMPNPDENKPFPLDYMSPRALPKMPISNGTALAWIFAGFLALLVIPFSAFFLLPSRNGSHSNPRVKSASNLRQIGQGILLYTNDFHGQYPDSFADILENEDITSDAFVSPLRSETPATGPTTQAIAAQLSGSHLSYVYLGKGFTKDTVTPDTVVAYELLVSPGSGTNVLFGDGHVEYVDPKIAARIVAAVAAGQHPVTMPSLP